MSGLILELQEESFCPNLSASYLLRKALAVSSKLEIHDMDAWIRHELNGYSSVKDVPNYRRVKGYVGCRSPFNGWIPLVFGDVKVENALSNQALTQPIGTIEDLINKSKENSFFVINFPHDVQKKLMEEAEIESPPMLRVSVSSLAGILEAVRNKILQWALELEKNGITGEGMTFSSKEKDSAISVTYQIANNIGSMNNSQLQQHTISSTQSLSIEGDTGSLEELVKVLKNSIDAMKLDHAEQEEYKAEISTLESQLASPKPKKTIISESLKSLRTILEGAAGNILANELLSKISPIMQLYS